MKISFAQLQNQLNNNLAPIYFISGDEPFQVDEACRMVRQSAEQQGYSERQVSRPHDTAKDR